MPRVIPVGPLLPSPLFSKSIDKTETNKEGDERFLLHCGWNSVIESIASGVPILESLIRSEQKMNARFMVDVAKVAVEFKRSNESEQVIPRDEVERVGRLVMQEEAGKLLRSNLKQSALKNAGSLKNLTKFLALCGSQCNPGPAILSKS